MTAVKQPSQWEADDLYERYAKPLEDAHRGEYVAVSRSGQTVLASTVREAIDRAVAAFGPGSLLFKIGEKTVWRWR